MTHTETIGSKGKGFYLDLLTSSVTTAINEGEICSLDSSGNVIKCATDEDVKVIGVAANTVRARDTASSEPISVQTRGVVKLYGWRDGSSGHTTAMVSGEKVKVGKDASSAYTGQVVVFSADNEASQRKQIGLALNGVSTTDTRTAINVLLTL